MYIKNGYYNINPCSYPYPRLYMFYPPLFLSPQGPGPRKVLCGLASSKHPQSIPNPKFCGCWVWERVLFFFRSWGRLGPKKWGSGGVQKEMDSNSMVVLHASCLRWVFERSQRRKNDLREAQWGSMDLQNCASHQHKTLYFAFSRKSYPEVSGWLI